MISHSMDEAQVARVSKALKGSADAIQGISTQFDIAEAHYRRLLRLQGKLVKQVEGSLDACTRLEAHLHSRLEAADSQFDVVAEGLCSALESMVCALEDLNIEREVSNVPKVMVSLMIPLIILMIELAVANPYLGIMVASMPEVRDRYSWCSPFLLGSASCVLFGLTISLVWLAGYRVWLASGSRQFDAAQALAPEEGTGDDCCWRQTAEAPEPSEAERQRRSSSRFREGPAPASPVGPALQRSMSMPVLEAARLSGRRSDGSSGELLRGKAPGRPSELERRAELRAMMAGQAASESAPLRRARVAPRSRVTTCAAPADRGSVFTAWPRADWEQRASERRRRDTTWGARDPGARREPLRGRLGQRPSGTP